MLAALALVFLVSCVTEGRIVSKCELKEQLEESQIQVITSIGDKTTVDKLIARLVCNVEKTSGFNSSLLTSIQVNQDEFKPPFQTTSQPKEEKNPATEEDDEKLEEENIIPVQPQHERHDLFPGKTPAEMSGSGPEVTSEEDSSGDGSEEEGRDDVTGWNLLGIFQLRDRVACGPGPNRCGLECSALVDDDIADDIACLNILAGSSNKLLTVLPVKECRSVLPSEYFAECS